MFSFRKSLNIAALLFALLIGSVTVADAQYGYSYGPRGGSLAGTTKVIVYNASPFPIVSLWAVNHGGIFTPSHTNLLDQTGIIPPGGSRAVVFPTCFADVYVTTSTRLTHMFANTNICAKTRWTISW